jgi:hypothetical protein
MGYDVKAFPIVVCFGNNSRDTDCSKFLEYEGGGGDR